MGSDRATVVTFPGGDGNRYNVWVWHDSGQAEVNRDGGDGRWLPVFSAVKVEQQP